MVYDNWEQVAPHSNSKELTTSVSQELDYRRFTSDSTISFCKSQIEIINSLCPDHLITHNGMTLFSNINYHEMGFRQLEDYVFHLQVPRSKLRGIMIFE